MPLPTRTPKLSDADFVRAVCEMLAEAGFDTEYGHLNFRLKHKDLDLPFITSFHCHIRGDRLLVSGKEFDLNDPKLPETIFRTLQELPI